ncbi:TRAP transporter large permease [Oceanibaculum pacificum]|uniref:TRAP transporter large permease protein n=1 Tax=Oceanibaculum pacificum TaxID=580166 RepID=A0A154W239_9PROT|nr:TRAP transporter large permease subunit [Oceanibaculum pacificum]KZD07523.1 C4-dicarboxylate ABC transporter permease [Oceanibaculum pacificum]
MENALVSVSLILFLLMLLAGGIWIGLSLLGVAIAGMFFFSTRPIGDPMAIVIWDHAASWTLTALPLFIWMGEILLRTKVTKSMFSGLTPWVNWMPGRLLHVNTVGCTIFAAVCGSSAATCATIGKLTIPELRRRGYPDKIVVGSLAGPATLGLLIPPSITMIIYGVSADVSVTKLFVAGILPGMILATMFIMYTAGWSAMNARLVPTLELRQGLWWRFYEGRHLLPILGLILLVIGTIYSGVATPTEAAAIGVVGSLALSAADRTLNWKNFVEGVAGATRLFAMIALILAGSAFMTLAMGYIGLPRHLASWITGLNLSPPVLILLLTVLYAILGCFLEGVAIIVLTVAIILPTIQAVGLDLIWFGIFVVVVVEMAQITPPVGINLFIIQGLSGLPLEKVSLYVLPYFLIMLVMIALIYLFPEIVLWLPSQV